MIPGDADNDNDYVDIMVATCDVGIASAAKTINFRLVVESDVYGEYFSLHSQKVPGHNGLMQFNARHLYVEDV